MRVPTTQAPVAIAVAMLVAGLGGACASDRAARTEVLELRRQVDRLRQQSTRDARLVRQLENRIFLLEDKLETAAVAHGRTPDAVPRLPVVRKASPTPLVAGLDEDPGEYPSAGGASNGASNGARAGDDAGDPLGDDVEVVYEGAAAHDSGPRPVLRLHESSRPDDMIPVTDAPDPSAPRARARTPVHAEVPRAPAGPEGYPDPSRVADRIPLAPLPGGRAGGIHSTDVPGAAASPGAAPAPGATPPFAGEDPVSVYREAHGALLRRDHVVAIAGFQAFLKRWPDHDYADNSQYWLAEAFYDRRSFEQALAEFRRVVKRYPSGNKAPDALLKIGYCYARLGDLPAARDVLAQVIEVYPRTEAARLAGKRLEELRE